MMLEDGNVDVREAVEKTLEEYNRYRRRVAEARLVKLEGDEVVLEVSGALCQTCGAQDYLEDFIYEMERVTDEYEAEMEGYRQIDEESYIVKYRVKPRKVKRV